MNIVLACVLVGSIVVANAAHIPVNIITGPDEIPPIDQYDPFADVNSLDAQGYPDGKIDMADIGYVSKKFGTQGNSSRNVTMTNLEGIPCGGCQPPGIYKDAVEIVVLEWTSVEQSSTEAGVILEDPAPTCLLPFAFCTDGKRLINVTDLWIVITQASNEPSTQSYNITINSVVSISTGPVGHSDSWNPLILTIHLEDANVIDRIQPGVNTLWFHNVQPDDIWIYRVTILIEYYYAIP